MHAEKQKNRENSTPGGAKKVFLRKKRSFFVLGVAFLLCFALFALFGCDEMSPNEKTLCYSLASKSYAYIPACETEQSCFEKVDELFKTKLNYAQETNLYEVKNHFARSWFFYNKSVKEFKNISALCQAGAASSLPGAINQAHDYLNTSFIEMDEGIKKSFEVVSLEEKYLTEQKIDLTKEEELFGTLVELRQIITELNNGGAPSNSDSYVAYYNNKIASFNSVGYARGFDDLAEKNPFWLQKYSFYEGTILKPFGLGNNILFPFAGQILDKAVSAIETDFYSRQSLALLQRFPASELMALYSELAGNDSSAFKRFSDMINRASKNYESAEKEAQGLWSAVEKLKEENQALLEETKSNSAYDALAAELLSGAVIAQRNFEEESNVYTRELLSLREQKSRGSLMLGEELLRLKTLNNNFLAFKQELEFRKESYLTRLGAACGEKASEIKEKNVENENEFLMRIWGDTVFFASKTLGASGAERLNYCIAMVEKEKDFVEGKNNFEELKAKKVDAAHECFSYLEGVFKYAELKELENLFSRLQSETVTEENILFFEESCESIKTQVENELRSDKELQEIISNYQGALELIPELKSVSAALNNTALESEISLFEKKITNYSAYFDNKNLRLNEVLPVKSSLSESLKKLRSEANLLLEEKIIEYAKNNLRVVALTQQVPMLGEDTNSLNRIIIPNPFREVHQKISFNFGGENGTLNAKDNAVENVSFGENSFVILSFLPSGQTKVDFWGIEKVISAEKDEVVFASNEQSLIQRSLALETKKVWPLLNVKTTKPPRTESAVVMIDGFESRFSENDGTIYFNAKNASAKTKINIFFYLRELIALESAYVSLRSTDLYKQEIEYSIKATSNFDGALNATLSLPINVNGVTEGASVFDEGITQKQHEVINGKIVLKNQDFLPRQQKSYKVFLKVNNVFDYYTQELERLRGELGTFNESGLVGEINSFLALDLSAELVPKAEYLIKKAQARIDALNTERQKNIEFELARAALEEKIAQLENNLKILTDLGLLAQAEEMEALLASARTQDWNSTGGVAKALDLISKASFSIDQSVLAEAENIWKELQKISRPELEAARQSLLKLKEQIDEIISTDPAKAQEYFLELKDKYALFVAKKSELDKNAALLEEQSRKEFDVTLQKCLGLAGWLEKQLSEEEQKMLEAKIIPPITSARLKKIQLLLAELKTSDKNGESRAELDEIEKELIDAIDSLKRQAIRAYNSAIENGAQREVLGEAKKLLDSNNYVSAMLLLKSGGAEGLNIPFAGFIPIALIIIVAFVLRQRFGKKEKEEGEKKKAVLGSWKEEGAGN